MRILLPLLTTTALLLGGCADGADDPGTDAAAAPAATQADGAGGGTLTVTGTDEVTWAETMRSTGSGNVEVTIQCGPEVPHGLGIDGVQDGAELVACAGGGSDTATVELEPGEFTFFCTVPGHREAGMEGTLAVG